MNGRSVYCADWPRMGVPVLLIALPVRPFLHRDGAFSGGVTEQLEHSPGNLKKVLGTCTASSSQAFQPAQGVLTRADWFIINEAMPAFNGPILVRHEAEAPRERSTCGWRYRLISREDAGTGVAAWVHAVDIDGARLHFHKRGTELYYVLSGEGTVSLDGVEHPVRPGSLVHIPPGVVHGAKGRMRVLVVGIPDIAEDDLFFPDSEGGR